MTLLRRWHCTASRVVAEASRPRSHATVMAGTGAGTWMEDASVSVMRVIARPNSALAASITATPASNSSLRASSGHGGVLWQRHTRWMSSSRHLPLKDCNSLGEMIQMAHEHLDTLSARNISAFWTEVSKSLQRRNSGSLNDNPNAAKQLDGILCHTLEVVMTNTASLSPRDLSQTAISLTKIMKTIEDRRGRFRKGSPHQILRVLIGHNSQNRQFILRELAAAAMPMRNEFDPRHLSNLIYAFGLAEFVLEFDDGRTSFEVLADVALSELENFNGQDLSNMLWAYGNVKASNPKLFKEVGDNIASRKSLESFWPQALANIVWAYATLDEAHPALFRKVADHIVALGSLDEFRPQNLSNIVWACATAKESHPELFKKLGGHIVGLESLNAFNEQNLANTVWAYASAKEAHPKLYKKLGDHIASLKSLGAFAPQNLSNTVWAYATAKEVHPALFRKVADHIMSLDSLKSFDPQALSNVAWAFATAKEPHPKLFKKLGDHIASLQSLSAFAPQALSNIAWAYATAGELHPKLFKKLGDHIAHPKLFNKIVDAAIKRRPGFDPQGVANLLWAYATNGHIEQHLFQSFTPTAEVLLGEYNEQELGNIAWAYAVADVAAPSLFDEDFINACQEKEGTFTVEEMSQLHQWNLWQEELKSNVRLPSSLQQKCFDAFVSTVPRPSGLQDDVISVLSSIGLQPQEEVLTEKGYLLDALVEVNGIKIGIEVDGPSHFLGRKPTGSTILKHRQVAALEGVQLVSVPYWEWNKVGKPGKNRERKEKHLRSLLGMS